MGTSYPKLPNPLLPVRSSPTTGRPRVEEVGVGADEQLGEVRVLQQEARGWCGCGISTMQPSTTPGPGQVEGCIVEMPRPHQPRASCCRTRTSPSCSSAPTPTSSTRGLPVVGEDLTGKDPTRDLARARSGCIVPPQRHSLPPQEDEIDQVELFVPVGKGRAGAPGPAGSEAPGCREQGGQVCHPGPGARL